MQRACCAHHGEPWNRFLDDLLASPPPPNRHADDRQRQGGEDEGGRFGDAGPATGVEGCTPGVRSLTSWTDAVTSPAHERGAASEAVKPKITVKSLPRKSNVCVPLPPVKVLLRRT